MNNISKEALSAATTRVKNNYIDQICDQIRQNNFTNDLDDEYWRSTCGIYANQDGDPLTVVQSPFNPYMGIDDNPAVDPPSGNPDMNPPPLTSSVHNYPDPIYDQANPPSPRNRALSQQQRSTVPNTPKGRPMLDPYQDNIGPSPSGAPSAPQGIPPGQDAQNIIRTIDPRQSALRQNLPYGTGPDIEGTALGIAPRYGGMSPPIPGLFTNPGIHPYNIQQTEQPWYASDANDVFFHQQVFANRNSNLRSHDWTDTLQPRNPDIYVMSPIAAGALNTTVTKIRGPASEFVPENQTLMYDTRRRIGVMTNPYTQETYELSVEDIPPPNTEKNYIMEERLEVINPRLVGLQGYNPKNPRQSKREVCQDMPGPDHGRNPWGSQMYWDQIARRAQEIWSSQIFNNRNEILACEPQWDRYPNGFLGGNGVPIIRPPAYLPPTQRGNDAGMGGAAEYVQNPDNTFLQNRNSLFDMEPMTFNRKCKPIVDLWERAHTAVAHPDFSAGPMLPQQSPERQSERASYEPNKYIGSVEGQISTGTADLSRAALQNPTLRTDDKTGVVGSIQTGYIAPRDTSIVSDLVVNENEFENRSSHAAVQGHTPGTVGTIIGATTTERSEATQRGAGDDSHVGQLDASYAMGRSVRSEIDNHIIPQREGQKSAPGNALSSNGYGWGMERSSVSNIEQDESARPTKPNVGRALGTTTNRSTVMELPDDRIETQRETIGDVGHALNQSLHPYGGRNTQMASTIEEPLRRPMEVRGLQGRRVMGDSVDVNVSMASGQQRDRKAFNNLVPTRVVGTVDGKWQTPRGPDPVCDIADRQTAEQIDRMVASIQAMGGYTAKTDRASVHNERTGGEDRSIEMRGPMSHVLGVHATDRTTIQSGARAQERNNHRASTGIMRDTYGAVGSFTTQSTANETPSDARVPQRADTGVNRQTMAHVNYPTHLGRTVDPSSAHIEPSRIPENLPPTPQRVPHNTNGARLLIGKVTDRIFKGKLPGSCRARPSTFVKNGFTSLGIQERTIPWSLVDSCNEDRVGWPREKF